MARWLANENGKGLKFDPKIAGEDFDTVVNGLIKMFETGRGLFLCGDVGCGKTFLMKNLYQRLDFHKEKRWVDCSDADGFLWVIDKNQNAEDYRKELNKVVFIDDFGVEVKTSYGRRVDFVGSFIHNFHSVGNGRLIISSNLNREMISQLYDDRLLDRILEMCVIVQFKGKSKRERVFA